MSRDISKANRYYNLKWIVCVYNGRFWEEIAAFNVDRAALQYAENCWAANNSFQQGYRVIERKSNREHIEIQRWGNVT